MNIRVQINFASISTQSIIGKWIAKTNLTSLYDCKSWKEIIKKMCIQIKTLQLLDPNQNIFVIPMKDKLICKMRDLLYYFSSA